MPKGIWTLLTSRNMSETSSNQSLISQKSNDFLQKNNKNQTQRSQRSGPTRKVPLFRAFLGAFPKPRHVALRETPRATRCQGAVRWSGGRRQTYHWRPAAPGDNEKGGWNNQMQINSECLHDYCILTGMFLRFYILFVIGDGKYVSSVW